MLTGRRGTAVPQGSWRSAPALALPALPLPPAGGMRLRQNGPPSQALGLRPVLLTFLLILVSSVLGVGVEVGREGPESPEMPRLVGCWGGRVMGEAQSAGASHRVVCLGAGCGPCTA